MVLCKDPETKGIFQTGGAISKKTQEEREVALGGKAVSGHI